MDLNHPIINTIGQGWNVIEDELPSRQAMTKEPGPRLLAKVKEHIDLQKEKKAALVKAALQIQRKQFPTVDQVSRQPSAVIIKGNPALVDNNPLASKFYNNIAAFLRQNKYSVTFDKGEPFTKPTHADLWIGHSRGADRLRFARKGTKTVDLNEYEHPVAKAWINRQKPGVQQGLPPPHHYFFTNEQKQAILKQIQKK